MELDFTKLNSLAFMGFSEIPPEKQPSKTPLEPLLEPEPYKSPLTEENALQGQLDGLQGIPILQREADAIKQERERAVAVYGEYQKNIKLSGQLQTDILKGVKRGEDIYSLFLKAVQAISLMTSNSLFYSQIEADTRAIYGEGLQEQAPLQCELAEVQKRLTRLKEAQAEELEHDSRERIGRAIQAHEAKIAQLQGKIDRANNSI